MAVTQSDLNNFHQFACSIVRSDKVQSMHELFEMWLLQNPPDGEQAAATDAINEGLTDIDAGRVYDYEQVNAEIRDRHGWSSGA